MMMKKKKGNEIWAIDKYVVVLERFFFWVPTQFRGTSVGKSKNEIWWKTHSWINIFELA